MMRCVVLIFAAMLLGAAVGYCAGTLVEKHLARPWS